MTVSKPLNHSISKIMRCKQNNIFCGRCCSSNSRSSNIVELRESNSTPDKTKQNKKHAAKQRSKVRVGYKQQNVTVHPLSRNSL